MREIKFRAWDKINRRMWQHNEITIWDRHMQDDMSNQYAPLMQFTGLTDKNGTEIYEGDILQSQEGDKHIWQIIFDDGCFELIREVRTKRKKPFEKEICCQDNVELYDLIKIGNIYENPELLK